MKSVCLTRFIAVGLFLTLAGCEAESPLEGLYQDYEARLSRVLEIDLPPPDEPSEFPLRYPSARALSWETTQQSINLWDLLQLSGCDLSRLIGHRNSSLGKVMPPSQRWQYEAEFIRAGTACMEYLKTEGSNPDLIERLQEVLTTKRQELLAVVWNATWGSIEFQALMAFREGPFPPDFELTHWKGLSDALIMLGETVEQFLSVALVNEIEEINSALAKNPVYGRLILSQEISLRYLRRVNHLLAERLNQGPVCRHGRPTQQAEILNNVLIKVYVQKLQPFLGQLQQAGEQWGAYLEDIHIVLAGDAGAQGDTAGHDATSGAMPAAHQNFYKRYIQQGETSLQSQLSKAIREHARLWTSLLTQCALQPGSNPGSAE